MPERIDIVVPDGELAQNSQKLERLRKTRAFEQTDRAPVQIDVNLWFMLRVRGLTFAEYTKTPRDNLRQQILNFKWRCENIRDDIPIPTKAQTFEPDLGCLRGLEWPMEIRWMADQPPKAVHPVTAPEQIDRLEIPDPAQGLNAKRIEWHKAMCDAADDFDVRVNGEPLRLEISLSQPGGPIPSAFALAGSNLFLWMAMDPGRAHRLMDLATESHMRTVAYMAERTGRPTNHPLCLGADTCEMLSPEMFREFVAPYYVRTYAAHPGPRGFHSCGKNEHLLDCFLDDLRITSFDGFGYCVNMDLYAEKTAGKVVLTGGPHPMIITDGPEDAIVAECMRYIKCLGKKGGYILSTGGGPIANTPLEHLHAMVEASKRAGDVRT